MLKHELGDDGIDAHDSTCLKTRSTHEELFIVNIPDNSPR